jgi:hypothetical protein
MSRASSIGAPVKGRCVTKAWTARGHGLSASARRSLKALSVSSHRLIFSCFSAIQAAATLNMHLMRTVILPYSAARC